MKPAPFEYFAPTTVDEALGFLAQHGYDAKILAGGQSLIPTMNFRLAQPAVLIDLNNIPDLFYIRPGGDGGLSIGAMTRHAQVETSTLVAERSPLLHDAMPQIATSQIRSRGTIGGSISHADPSAELVTVSVALEARFRLRGPAGERWVSADEFFVGMFATLLEPEDLLMEIEIPLLPPRTGWSLQEVARRPHDYALVGVAAVVTLDEQDICRDVRLVFLSVGDGPVQARQAQAALIDQSPSPVAIQAAADTAAAEIDPGNDIHATAAYRRHLARVLTRRALEQAFTRAGGGS